MVKFQYKLIKIFVFSFAFSTLSGCYSEPEYIMKRVPYEGNELRIDGYYYHQRNDFGEKTDIYFLFRNGVIYYEPYSYSTNDLNEVEQMIIRHYEHELFKHPNGWGIFEINGNRLEYETYFSLCGLTRYIGRIENDTTMHLLQSIEDLSGISSEDKIFHFKKFSPKPDSIKSFIK